MNQRLSIERASHESVCGVVGPVPVAYHRCLDTNDCDMTVGIPVAFEGP